MFLYIVLVKTTLKVFGSYQRWLAIFEDLREVEINAKEVLKNLAKFKTDLNEIKTGGKKSTHTKHNR